LTELQQETLVAALEAGYYELPREVTMGELAERLGVSQQALAKRLRRGYRNLIEDSLVVGTPDDDR
jgi:predicted DNA binding protein